nr:MAG TPA: hypothetical protein [Bacteriophage sp.]
MIKTPPRLSWKRTMAEPPEPTKSLNDAYYGGSFVNETPLASATQAH